MWKFLVYLMYVGGDGEQAGTSCARNKPVLEIVTSQRGKPVLLRAGYRYNEKRKNKDGSCVWICTKRDVCKAKLVTDINNFTRIDEKHNCRPDFASNELELQFDKCVDKIKSDFTVTVPSVFRETIAGLKDKGIDLITKLPKYETVEKKLYRKRNNSLGVKKLCFKTLREVEVPEKFKSFLLADYSNARSRILVFASEQSKKMLRNPDLKLLCDGTFKFCLKPFKQLYTLHLDLGSTDTHNNIIPVIYALLPNKLRSTYKTLFRLIKNQIPEFYPKSFLVDFEYAAMSAINEVFPESYINGCFFNFSQSLWRKADKLGITKSKLNRKHIKKCTVLAHLPKEAVDSGWLYLMSHCPKDNKMVQFNDYFVETWLNNTSFFADKWSSYNVDHRTTNMIESWHATVNKKVNDKLKSIAHFLILLQKEDNYYHNLFNKRKYITKKSQETCEIDQLISTTINDFINGYISIDLCIERLVL